EKYAQTLPEANRQDLSPLLADWSNRLGMARRLLLETLDGRDYGQFTMDFGQFVVVMSDIPPEESQESVHVRHVAPGLIYQQYGIVRAYETILETISLDALHELRIQCKRLRYMLESFEDVLGGDAKTVIDSAKGLQDHLGDLQDARVANQIMHEYTLQVD